MTAQEFLDQLDRVESAWVTLWALNELTGRGHTTTTARAITAYLCYETPVEVLEGVLERMTDGFRETMHDLDLRG